MRILKERYGSQNGIINAHKKILMGGKVVADTIADFEGLSNNFKKNLKFPFILTALRGNFRIFFG